MAQTVLVHFVDDPQLATDLIQIARWRIPQATLDYTVAQVGEALNWLVREGFLLKTSTHGVAPVYSLNPERAGEARQFVESRHDVRAHEHRVQFERPAHGPVMNRALAWLDAVLLLYHWRHPHEIEDRPGLARSLSSIETLLLRHGRDTGRDVKSAERAEREAARQLDVVLGDPASTEALAHIHRTLALDTLESRALLLCLAPELDPRFHVVFGILNDDMGRRTPSLALTCAILGEPPAVRDALARSTRLTSWRLFESGVAFPLADEPLRPDPSITHWLLDDPGALMCDPKLGGAIRREPWFLAGWVARATDPGFAVGVGSALASRDSDDWLVLSGPDPSGWRVTLELAVRESGTAVIRVSPGTFASTHPTDVTDAAVRVARAAALANAVPVLDLGEASSVPVAREIAAAWITGIDMFRGLKICIVQESEQIVSALPRDRCQLLHRAAADVGMRSRAYAAAAADAGLDLADSDSRRLARTYPLSFEAIDAVVKLARLRTTGRPTPARGHACAIAAACRRVAAPDLPRFARRIDPAFDIDDIVLPAETRAQLFEMVSHVAHASRVLTDWGFEAQMPLGRGVTALFCGPSGTGKTMAAQAVARALNTEACHVDLSRVFSKYIGESEKNLDVVFDDAEKAGAVLLFDEADALFGKRTEIKDAHDRYANIEVAYLLQRMESFTGLAILTTNLRQNLDQAFTRRLRFILEFQKPDVDAREEIWRRCVPKGAPTAPLNLRFLARQLELTGGAIRQITLRAGFLAANEQAGVIEMRHLVTAARAELLKLGLTAAERELAAHDLSRLAPARVA